MFIHILTLSVVIRRNSIKSRKILYNVTKPHAHALSCTDHRIDAVILKTRTHSSIHTVYQYPTRLTRNAFRLIV